MSFWAQANSKAVGAEGLAGCQRVLDVETVELLMPGAVKWVPLPVRTVYTL